MSTKVGTKRTKTKLPAGIIPSGDGPGLFRVRFADGTLSDVTNLARAQDALRAAQEGQARMAVNHSPSQGMSPESAL